MAVSLPVVLLILDVYPLRRLGGARGWWGEPARWVYIEKIPFVLLALAASASAFIPQIEGHNMPALDELSVLGRLAVSAYGLSFYLWKMVLPLNLSPLYELRGQDPLALPFLLGYGVVPAVTALALILRHRLPGLPAAWLAYVVILLPVLGIFQNGPQIAADRYTYLAGLGWALLASAGLLAAWRRRSFPVTGLAVFLLLGFGTLTWSQVRVWHDSEKLWSHAVAIDPRSSIGQLSLGLALERQGKLAEAVEHYEAALRLEPGYVDADYAWGNALARQGKLAEAVEHYEAALRVKPDHANAHANAGSALVRQGKLAEAIAHYEQILKIRPDHVDAHTNLGLALARQGKLVEAIAHYEQALRIKPDHSAAHTNWGDALAQQGKPAEAIEHYQQALHVKPDNALAHNNWGVALLHQGRLAEAIEHFRQALIISPDFADAHTNWGFALTRQGHQAEANAHYQQALHLRTGPSNTASKP
jgi:tetratricopeptide (TPR) repeat protein